MKKYVTELFDIIWISTHWTDEDLSGANSILESLLVPANDVAVMISASYFKPDTSIRQPEVPIPY